MASFATVSEYEARYGDVDDDAPLQIALNQATRLIQVYTGQTLFEVEDDEIVLDGNDFGIVMLPQWPVTAIEEVVLDDDDDPLVFGADEDYVWTSSGVLRRIGGAWGLGYGNIAITYTHGYAEIPDDIKLRTMQIARAILTSDTEEASAS